MSSTFEPTALTLNRPRSKARRGGFGLKLILGFCLVVIPSAGLWAAGYRPRFPWSNQAESFRTVAVNRGDIRVFVLESGTLESSDNATIKCQVEALMGMVGGAQGGANGGMGGRGGGQGAGAAGGAGAGGAGGAGAGGGQAASGAKAGGAAGAGAGGAKGGAGGAGATGGMVAGGGGGAAAMAKPQIKSFTMQVIPHMPLRPRGTISGTTKGANQGMGMGRGGAAGGGGGGGNRGGGQDMGGEKPGSTKILKLIPEGERVKAGDIVCELDSAAFRDELQAQLIRWSQAKGWVDQAREILAVSKISLREYRDGIYPQDLEQLEKYIQVCRTQLKQSQDNVAWSREMTAMSFQSPSQLRASELGEQQMRIALIEAEGMKNRLIKYTAPRLLSNLEAKIASVEADLLAQESTYQLEDDRKRRLERMIELCILRAPRDGMIAYAPNSSGPGWNPTYTPIQEGLVVRQGQSLVMVPDPTKMMVKVRVNESKVSEIFVGQRAVVQVEAFADRPLQGRVTAITAIPAAASGPGSDVKLYYANVEIDGGFDGLRTGLSAQVAFFVAEKPDVARIPLESIRWSGGEAFAAIPQKDKKGVEWRSLRLGLVGTAQAEVLSGLTVGEQIVAHPEDLPAPPAAPLRAGVPIAVESGPAKSG